MLGMLNKEREEFSRKPKYSRFTQQELPACRLLLTPALVILSLLAIGAVFIPLGAVCLSASNQVVEVVTQYDEACLANMTNDQRNNYTRKDSVSHFCQLGITISQTMNPPVYVYYQLTNFYQNYRRYVKSQSESQLAGTNVTGSGLDVCAPEDYLGGDYNKPILPCGLVAWSLFNDTYSMSLSGSGLNATLPIDSSDISWPSDRDTKFGNVYPQNFNTNTSLRGGATIDNSTTLSEAQNLQVWMRTAALPTFRKLYGKISVPLTAGSTVLVNIQNRYNSYAYGGTKSIVISTASWLGGKNSFLGIAYLTVGGICVFLSVVFFILQFTNYRPLGDTSYLSWNKKAAEMRSAVAQEGLSEQPTSGSASGSASTYS